MNNRIEEIRSFIDKNEAITGKPIQFIRIDKGSLTEELKEFARSRNLDIHILDIDYQSLILGRYTGEILE